jgi:hypothetical protein
MTSKIATASAPRMKILLSRSEQSIGLAHFRGIAPASARARVRAVAAAPTPATKPRARSQKRITFAGIGGGGFRQQAAANQTNTVSDAVRIRNQKRIDAMWDQAAVTAGIVKR